MVSQWNTAVSQIGPAALGKILLICCFCMNLKNHRPAPKSVSEGESPALQSKLMSSLEDLVRQQESSVTSRCLNSSEHTPHV